MKVPYLLKAGLLLIFMAIASLSLGSSGEHFLSIYQPPPIFAAFAIYRVINLNADLVAAIQQTDEVSAFES